jgi:hypothetical protein
VAVPRLRQEGSAACHGAAHVANQTRWQALRRGDS